MGERLPVMILAAALLLSSQGCFTGNRWSLHESGLFMERPTIVQKKDGYFLTWRYGAEAFYFFPESRIDEGRPADCAGELYPKSLHHR